MPSSIDRAARAMQESKAWPAVFKAGTANELAFASLAAVRSPSASMIAAGAKRQVVRVEVRSHVERKLAHVNGKAQIVDLSRGRCWLFLGFALGMRQRSSHRNGETMEKLKIYLLARLRSRRPTRAAVCSRP